MVAVNERGVEGLRELVAGVLETDPAHVPEDALFFEDLEVDSLQKTEIVARVEQQYGVRLDDEDTTGMRSVSDIVTVLRRRGAVSHERRSSMDLYQRLVGQHLAAGRGDRICYVDPDVGEVTYDQLDTAARRYAGGLHSRGVRPGTRALVVSDDSVAAVAAILGLWWSGCVPVPVSPMLQESEIEFIARDCAAGVAHLDVPERKRAELGHALRALVQVDGRAVRDALRAGDARAVPGSDDAPEPMLLDPYGEVLVQYTSGSTGTPRGVRHGVVGVQAVLAGFGRVLGLSGDDRVLSTAKLSFGYGFGNSLLFPLAAGARTILLQGAVDPGAVSAAVRRHRPTVLCSVPRIYAGLLAADRSGAVTGDSLRLAVSAGEHLPAELSRRFADAFGVPLVNGLGATELLHIVIATDPTRSQPGATGFPLPGVTVSLRDDAGRVLHGSTEGRLHVAGPSVALGYVDRPEATATTFHEDGAYTGDIVRRDGNGEIRYVCRADDMLNLGGHRVAPAEIEAVVRKAEGVSDCAVVGAVDGQGLQQAVAYVVPHPGTDPGEVRRATVTSLRTNLAMFKRPARVEVVDALPTTSTGKLARFKLRTAEAVR